MKTQITSTILGLVLGLTVGSSFASADEVTHDDFTNPDPTNPDREPWTWALRYGTDISIENENLIIEDDPGTGGPILAGAFVNDFTSQDVILEAQFRIVEGTNAGVCFLPTGICGHLSVSESPWPLKAMLNQWETTLAQTPIDFDASEEDVVLRLQAMGNQLSLWIWPADETGPEQPLVRATKPGAQLSDAIGVVVDNGFGGDNSSQAEFRYFEAEVIPPLPGDFNKDWVLDLSDVIRLSREIYHERHRPEFNLNPDEDELVDQTDLEIWVHDYRKTWYGDANLDGQFNTGDLTQVLEAGKYETQAYARWSEGDWNADGVFDTGDLMKALEDGGYEKGPQEPTAVPEPSAALLLLVASGLCWWVRRR